MAAKEIRFFSGPSSSTGPELIDECLRRLTGPRQTFVYVTPTARRARSFEQQLLRLRPQGFFRPYLLTFHSLMQLLYRRMGGTGAPISASVKAMLIEEIISAGRLRLSYFAGRTGKPFPGLVSRLAGFISDLKQNLIDPNALDRRIRAIERPVGAKSRDLVRIYREYQSLLERYNLIDTDGMFWLVLEELAKPGRLQAALDGIDLFIFDGFFDVTVAEGEVLGKLLEQAENVWMRLDCLPDAPAFEAAHHFVSRYGAKAERVEVRPVPGSPAESIPARLFDHEHPSEATATPTPAVSIFECRDRLAEAEAVAAEIKRISALQGFDVNRIAVTFKSVDIYMPLFREVFASCGVPYNCPVGRPLLQSPMVAALMGLLQVVRQDYSRESVLTLLRSPYVRFSFDYQGRRTELDGDFLDTEARVARIFRGGETWAARLQDSIDLLEKELQNAAESEDGVEDRNRASRRLAKLKQERRGVVCGLDEISKLSHPMEPAKFRKTLNELIESFGIARGIFFRHEGAVEEEILERDYRALTAFQKVLQDLMIAAGLAGRKTFRFDEYAEVLEAGISTETFDVRRHVDYGVHVLPLDEVRGGDYDVVFIAGMVDGEFPLPEPPRIFYPQSRRRRLGFKTEPTSLQIERYLFASAVATPRRRLILSYPRSDNARTLLRSLFISEIERIVPGVQPGRHPAPGALFSPKSVQYALSSGLAARDRAEAEEALELCSRAPDANARAALSGLALEEQRRRGDAWSLFEGMLADPEVKRLIAEEFQNRSFSVSALQKYARCPFRFFAEEVARLAGLEEPREEMDAVEKGSVIHRILGRFYIQRRELGMAELREDDDRDAALDLLRRIAEEEFQRIPYEGLFWRIERERVMGGPGRGARGVLELFVDEEMKNRSECAPRFFEVSFGRPRLGELTDTALSPPEVVIASGDEQVRLSGRIDRVEIAEAGGQRLALAVDYKTGTPPRHSAILQHTILQLPIYMMALAGSGYCPVGGAYYCLKDNPEDFGKFGKQHSFFGSKGYLEEYFGVRKKWSAGMFKDDELARIIDGIRSKVVEYARGIRAGAFNPSVLSRSEAGCRYCVFSGVCRRDDAKAMRIAAAVAAQEERANA